MSDINEPRKGIVHRFTPLLTAFEHTPKQPYDPQPNILLWVAGLSDGLLTVQYPTTISDRLPPGWSLVQVLLSSSNGGWGTASLQQDVAELAKCVEYFRKIRNGFIVIMGHSTGCQDVMEYLTGQGHESRPPIDGAILQAPVSDREALRKELSPEMYDKCVTMAQEMISVGKGEDMMPASEIQNPFGAPVCARRWLSLASPNHDGDDDYFSSDLTDSQLAKTFGSLPKRTCPLCILYSGSDDSTPDSVDKEALVKRWIGIVRAGGGVPDGINSGVVRGASHNLNGNPKEVVSNLVERTLRYLHEWFHWSHCQIKVVRRE